MTRTWIAVLMAAVVVVVLVGVTPVQAWVFGRFRVTAFQTLFGIDGQPIERFQVFTVRDDSNVETCLVIVRDAETGLFTTTAVPNGSCRWAPDDVAR
jgi:hypothetical protein